MTPRVRRAIGKKNGVVLVVEVAHPEMIGFKHNALRLAGDFPESEGLPEDANRIVQVAGDRDPALDLVRGESACDGTTLVTLTGERAVALVATVRRFQEPSGRGKEREA